MRRFACLVVLLTTACASTGAVRAARLAACNRAAVLRDTLTATQAAPTDPRYDDWRKADEACVGADTTAARADSAPSRSGFTMTFQDRLWVVVMIASSLLLYHHLDH